VDVLRTGHGGCQGVRRVQRPGWLVALRSGRPALGTAAVGGARTHGPSLPDLTPVNQG
jgi:hypothetical protein